ncbi:putative pentatricopeptide repeat-containing protein [Corchorus olitorius]|uniref:Pentatricopeptide repeat-containing protein n=1 Tax=Corchorus olitorius TaxID=93759 RepID=A0A1R3HLW8_9ROSI|nr:putative pentatricopeptide repeat-containing protein [Corchorus olitorius]
MDLIKLMEPSFPLVSIGLVNQLLKLVGKSGKIESMMKVLQWMEDAGIQPSNGMIVDIVSFSQKGCGAEYAEKIRERLESMKRYVDQNSSGTVASSLD